MEGNGGADDGGPVGDAPAAASTLTVPAVPADPELPGLPGGEQAGSAPGDRPFRPDVEGLRAVAVVLVVLFHAGVHRISGGYVGVDVFFVISGFVITGVLLREHASTGRTSLLAFYGRRSRRIIPVASLVIVVTVVAAYLLLGVAGNRTATDGFWAAIFLANFHFASLGTDYLTALQAPSPLQNFWTLSVEEQFYLVYPTLFLLLVRIRRGASFRSRLVPGLCVVIVVSFALSVTQTASNPGVAYFSPFTRAWELAVGALVAAGTPWLLRLPARFAAWATWAGLAVIAVAAVTFDAQTPFPGSAAALPVIGTALVIAGGTAQPRRGAERLLALWPFGPLGRLSYSLYLWHWPVLVLAAESAGATSLPVGRSLLWIVVALGLSMVTAAAIENPIRHAAALRRNRYRSLVLGAGLITVTLLVVLVGLRAHHSSLSGEPTAATTAQGVATDAAVERLVAAAPRIHTLPATLVPPLGVSVLGYPWGSRCWADPPDTSVPPCLFGDPRGTRTMVVTGDSHAQMWFYTLDAIAKEAHWKLWYLAKSSCPVGLLRYTGHPDDYALGGEYGACDRWHRFVMARIDQLDPDLVVTTDEQRQSPDNGPFYSDAQWRDGLAAFFRGLHAPKARFVVIGNIPMLPQSGPDCIARHTDDVQACSVPVAQSMTRYHQAEAAAVELFGGRYIDPTPWLCSSVCTAVIGDYAVYFDHFHLMGPYALHLRGVLAQALDLQGSG